MRFLLFLVIVLHGLIHLMGFAKAFRLVEISTLTRQPSTTAGLLWLLCALTFTVAGGLVLLKRDSWWMIALPAVILSQALIFGFWSVAKFGSIANLIILLPVTAAILEAGPGSYHNRYKTAVREGLVRGTEAPLVTEADLSDLPAPVQRYLRITGSVGKSRIQNFKAVFTGDFRNGLNGPWMAFRSEQYNFIDQPTRLFLMKARLYGLPSKDCTFFAETAPPCRSNSRPSTKS